MIEDRSSLPLLVFIHGPTGSGKTSVAVRAAKMFGAEIINSDSVQVYKSLDIGSAKPTEEEKRGVIHHLLGHVGDGIVYTAGEFRKDALEVISKRSSEGQNLFFVVGGSGFYSQALLKGLYPVPPSDPSVREQLRRDEEVHGLSGLFAELEARDPEYAKKIGPNDKYRVLRALEIFRSSSFQTMKEILEKFEEQRPPFRFVQIGMNHLRSQLKVQIEHRTQSMLRCGLLEETKSLLERGLGNWAALSSVGYREACDFLSGRISEVELPQLIVQSTMQLAKRQMTWFRRDKRIIWFDTNFDPTAPMIYLHAVSRAVRLDRGLGPPDTGARRFDS